MGPSTAGGLVVTVVVQSCSHACQRRLKDLGKWQLHLISVPSYIIMTEKEQVPFPILDAAKLVPCEQRRNKRLFPVSISFGLFAVITHTGTC